MAKGFDLIAEIREDSGKGASRRLRRNGKIPAILYGGGKPPRSVTFSHNEVMHQMENEAFFSSVLTVKVADKSQQAILKDVQAHPAKRQILHMDLQRIVADEKIRMTVPIHFLNEEIALGVKLGGGTVAHMITEVEVVCFPANLPEYLQIDIGELELDQTLYLADIEVPEGVEIPELAQEGDFNPGVVSIHIIKEVVEEVEEVEGEEIEGEEGELVEGEAAEGAEGAEGASDASEAKKDEEGG